MINSIDYLFISLLFILIINRGIFFNAPELFLITWFIVIICLFTLLPLILYSKRGFIINRYTKLKRYNFYFKSLDCLLDKINLSTESISIDFSYFFSEKLLKQNIEFYEVNNKLSKRRCELLVFSVLFVLKYDNKNSILIKTTVDILMQIFIKHLYKVEKITKEEEETFFKDASKIRLNNGPAYLGFYYDDDLIYMHRLDLDNSVVGYGFFVNYKCICKITWKPCINKYIKRDLLRLKSLGITKLDIFSIWSDLNMKELLKPIGLAEIFDKVKYYGNCYSNVVDQTTNCINISGDSIYFSNHSNTISYIYNRNISSRYLNISDIAINTRFNALNSIYNVLKIIKYIKELEKCYTNIFIRFLFMFFILVSISPLCSVFSPIFTSIYSIVIVLSFASILYINTTSFYYLTSIKTKTKIEIPILTILAISIPFIDEVINPYLLISLGFLYVFWYLGKCFNRVFESMSICITMLFVLLTVYIII